MADIWFMLINLIFLFLYYTAFLIIVFVFDLITLKLHVHEAHE